MASSSNPKKYYHVFLSFRGPDVRKNFLSHLYTALDQNGLNTFVDDEELRKGEEIWPVLQRAIQESRVAIIIFSKNYASSRWCLKELLEIMECKERNGLIVLPVFYKVEPRDVRSGRKSYGKAMAKHKYKFWKDSEEVKRWKKALLDAGNLSGWHFNDRDERDEAELIQSIIKELSIRLRPRSLDVAKYPVGIESRVQKLISLSESAGSDYLMIGLWGPGGIGKTTIAKALYNAIGWQFQGCSFLAQVREKSNQSGGHVDLQRQLLSEILPHKELTVYSVHGGISLIQERLCCKKVLLVLDDVDKMDQLDALARTGDWFGKGSRIIVTSRDKHILTSHGINCVYEVKTLDHDDAQDLFSQHAFSNSNVEIRRGLIDKALHYANGLPLALEVLGSFLCGENEAYWEIALRKLSKSLDPIINQVLKISFDGLDNNEREIFLDIACFFKGKRIEYIQEVLDSWNSCTTIGIENLIKRSLIKNESGYLQMHDLVQLMGMDIVKQECHDDPGKRSRIWLLEDAEDIFYYNMGTNAVKAIVLDLPPRKAININHDPFTNMKKLRILILSGVHIYSQVCLPSELRCLKWPNAPNLEFGFGPKKLVILDVPRNHIKQLGDNFQNFREMKSIDFTECKSLISIPDLSLAPNMEKLILNGCESLEEVHPSVGNLVKLEVLSLESCSNLSNFPNTLRTKSLKTLKLSGCSKFEKFPDIDGKMEHLNRLYLDRTAIKELPASIQNLDSVNAIVLSDCKDLVRLPWHIYKLKNLSYLNLSGCSNLTMFPKNMEDSIEPDGLLGFQKLGTLNLCGCNLSEVEFLESSSSFPNLWRLYLSYNKFTHLPTCINKYYQLRWLDIDGCELLQEIPQLPSNLTSLSASCCESLQKLPYLGGRPFDFLSVDLTSCCELFRKGVNIDDMANLLSLQELPRQGLFSIFLVGRELPKGIPPCEEDCISFKVPQDLYDKFKGLVLCVVLSPEEGKVVNVIMHVKILVNGQVVWYYEKDFSPVESDHVWLMYRPRDLNGVEKLMRNDWSHFQVYFRVKKGSIKKCGFRLICEQKEDDLRVVFPAPLAAADRNKLKRFLKFYGEDSEEDSSIDTEEEDRFLKFSGEDSEEDNSIDTEEEDTRIETDAEEN